MRSARPRSPRTGTTFTSRISRKPSATATPARTGAPTSTSGWRIADPDRPASVPVGRAGGPGVFREQVVEGDPGALRGGRGVLAAGVAGAEDRQVQILGGARI